MVPLSVLPGGPPSYYPRSATSGRRPTAGQTSRKTGRPPVRRQLESEHVDVNGEARLSLTVTNAGKRRGTEVVQLYAADTATGVTLPAQQLIGFARLDLEPGPSKAVRFVVPMSLLAYRGLSGGLVMEPGPVEVSAGSSSSDIRSSAKLTFTGRTRSIRVRTAPSSPSRQSASRARIESAAGDDPRAEPLVCIGRIGHEPVSARRPGGNHAVSPPRYNPGYNPLKAETRVRVRIIGSRIPEVIPSSRPVGNLDPKREAPACRPSKALPRNHLSANSLLALQEAVWLHPPANLRPVPST